jgi:hypothetical protein
MVSRWFHIARLVVQLRKQVCWHNGWWTTSIAVLLIIFIHVHCESSGNFTLPGPSNIIQDRSKKMAKWWFGIIPKQSEAGIHV